jgi:hypothetical protein
MRPWRGNPVQHSRTWLDQGVGLDGNKNNRMTPLQRHQPDSKDRSIGNADPMHGNWRLFGRTTKKISLASWPDPDGLMAEANNESRTLEAGARPTSE